MTKQLSLEALWHNLSILKSIEGRRAGESHFEAAIAIINEVNQAWAFPENSQELSKYGQMGYISEVGSPHQWWEENCKAYADACDKFPRSKDLNTVCIIATEALKIK